MDQVQLKQKQLMRPYLKEQTRCGSTYLESQVQDLTWKITKAKRASGITWKITKAKRASGTSEVVEWLPDKYKVMRSNTSTTKKEKEKSETEM
jgi:hypothetical protein